MHHLAAMRPLAHSELVVLGGHVERRLEHAQVWEHGEIGYAKLSGERCLEIDPHKGHVVLHATSLLLAWLPVEYL